MHRVELPAASSSPMLHHQQGQQARVVSPMPNFRLRAPFTAPQDRVPFATSSSPSLRAPQPISTSPEQAGHTSDVNFSSPSPQGDKSTDDDSWVPHQPAARVLPRAAKQVEQLSSEDKFAATDMARSASAPSATAAYAKPQRAATVKQTRKKASSKVDPPDAEVQRSSAAPAVSLGRPQARSEAKPDLSYAALIGRAILNSDTRKLSLNDIYLYIMQTWPYYKKDHAGWQNSIRHNLSLNDSFDKIARGPDNPGKGMLWTIVEGCEHRFAGGGYSKLPKKQGSSSPPPQETESPAAESSQASDHGPFLPPVHIEPSGATTASAPSPPAEAAKEQPPVSDRDPTPQPPSLAPDQMREATPPSTSPLPDGKAFPTEAEGPSGSQSPKSPHQRWSMSPLSMAQKGKLKAIDDYSSPSEEEAEELPPPASPAKKPQTPAGGPTGHRRTISATRCVTPYRLGNGPCKRSNGPDLLESSRALANLQDTPPPAAARYSPGQIHQTPKYIWELGDGESMSFGLWISYRLTGLSLQPVPTLWNGTFPGALPMPPVLLTARRRHPCTIRHSGIDPRTTTLHSLLFLLNSRRLF